MFLKLSAQAKDAKIQKSIRMSKMLNKSHWDTELKIGYILGEQTLRTFFVFARIDLFWSCNTIEKNVKYILKKIKDRLFLPHNKKTYNPKILFTL